MCSDTHLDEKAVRSTPHRTPATTSRSSWVRGRHGLAGARRWDGSTSGLGSSAQPMAARRPSSSLAVGGLGSGARPPSPAPACGCARPLSSRGSAATVSSAVVVELRPCRRASSSIGVYRQACSGISLAVRFVGRDRLL